MEEVSVISLLLLGFGLGLKHATEADHLAAVSTFVSERRSLLGASLIGGLWGIGHTISLFIGAIAVIVLHFQISAQLARGLEFCVALMLIVLGLNALRKVWRGGQLHMHWHRHGGHVHAHPHVHNSTSAHAQHSHNSTQAYTHHGFELPPRPIIVGMVHGFAGSGALMLLVLSTISSPIMGLLYVLIFGVGSIGGMMLMSLLLSMPFQLTAQSAQLQRLTHGLAGIFSLGFGLFLAYQIAFLQSFTPH
jgi:sulfite exporter TauE/SafE